MFCQGKAVCWVDSALQSTQKVRSSKNDLITKVHAPAERATQAKHVGAEKVQLVIPLLIISIRFRLPPERNFLLAVGFPAGEHSCDI